MLINKKKVKEWFNKERLEVSAGCYKLIEARLIDALERIKYNVNHEKKKLVRVLTRHCEDLE